MGFLGLDFTNVEAPKAPEFKSFKPGVYNLRVKTAEVKKTKNGGKMLKIEFAIIGGVDPEWKSFDGWKVFHTLNIEHTNPQVVEIGKQQINAMMIYMGVDPNSAEGVTDIFGKTVFAKLSTRMYEGKEQIDLKYFVEDKSDSTTDNGGELFN